MLRILATAVLIIVNYILQTTVLKGIEIMGIVPNTMICVTVSYALLRGSFEGLLVGSFSGLLIDMFFGNALGFYTLIGLLTGNFCGIFNKNFYRENYVLPFILTTISIFCYESIQYVFYAFFRGNINVFYYLRMKIIPSTVYTMLFSFIIYRLMYWFNEQIEKRSKYKVKQY